MKSKDKTTQKKVADSLLSSKSSFSVQEAYKTLRTNVMFSLPGSGCKCIGITSPNRGEGKSTISINLAISLAQLKKKVVLIDCDLRLPTIVSKLNLNTQDGLSNYLSGMIDMLPMVRYEKYGIDIVPSGIIPPDATALIDSKEMLEILKTLRNSYDYVILDFPPINIVSDAVLLSDVIDGYLIVVRDGVTEYQQINEALRQMNFSDSKIIGFVYNGKGELKKYYKKGYKYSKYYKNNHYYYKRPEQ